MQLPQLPQMPKIGRLSKKHKITAAGAAAATAVVLAVTGLQATGGSSSAAAVGDPTGYKVATSDQTKTSSAPKTDSASQKALSDQAAAQKKAAADAAAKKAAAEAAAKKAAAQAAAKKAAAHRAAVEAAEKRAARQAAVKRAAAKAAANRSTQRIALKVVPVASTTPVKTYTNDLDGWIKHSLDIMAADHIPGSYNGIYRNIIRESSGNPNAINLWDSNAAKGIPSKGLLQVIDPTFQAYHVAGTSWNIYDPVANITAACNYAYHVYGSMDNVNSAY